MDVNTIAKYALVVLGYAALGGLVYLGKYDATTYASLIVGGIGLLTGYHANGAK